jgi:transposase
LDCVYLTLKNLVVACYEHNNKRSACKRKEKKSGYVFCTKILHHKWAIYIVYTADSGSEMNNIDSAYEILYSWNLTDVNYLKLQRFSESLLDISTIVSK